MEDQCVSQHNGYRCQLFIGHSSYHAYWSRIKDLWIEWF